MRFRTAVILVLVVLLLFAPRIAIGFVSGLTTETKDTVCQTTR
ncbi:MAG TPA: hypothetical protein VFA46_13535 [Actinomycetes bacterium]|nr:hypothetical protein [Actinomycetes bacterium]